MKYLCSASALALFLLVTPLVGAQDWVKAPLPAGMDPYFVGNDEQGGSLYAARTVEAKETVLGFANERLTSATFVVNGKKIVKTKDFELFTNWGEWVRVDDGRVPTDALVAGKTSKGKPLYFSVDLIEGAPIWTPLKDGVPGAILVSGEGERSYLDLLDELLEEQEMAAAEAEAEAADQEPQEVIDGHD